jgi:glycosyltransferase involved in cell wall biosynthesis
MSERIKTLVILSPGFPENEDDSTCVPPQQVFVKSLKQNYPGLHIIVLAFQYPYSSDEYQWNGVTVIPFSGQNKGKLMRLNNWMHIRIALQRLQKQYKLIGLLSFWMGDCAFIADAFAKKNGLKHFSWILGQDAKPGNKYFKWIKPGGESLIALSDFIKREFHKNYRVKPGHVIPVGIDPALFGTAPAERDIDVLGAGSLIPLKQYHVLVGVVNSLRNSFPNIKAVICGGGTELEPLQALVKTYGLEAHIKFTGELPHTSVLALMQRTKVFVHTSNYEGFGMVCAEALHAGAQVVSFIRPMEANIKHWHFAHSEGDMVNVVKGLLGDPKSCYCPVSPYLVSDNARAMIDLFGYSEAEI